MRDSGQGVEEKGEDNGFSMSLLNFSPLACTTSWSNSHVNVCTIFYGNEIGRSGLIVAFFTHARGLILPSAVVMSTFLTRKKSITSLSEIDKKRTFIMCSLLFTCAMVRHSS